MAKTRTNEGAVQYDHSLNHAVEFFSKAGSLMKKRGQFYGGEVSALDLFMNMWIAGDKVLGMKLLFWLRDPRGGAGNRSAFRDCLKWLAETDGDWAHVNAKYIAEYGRWDDLTALFDTHLAKTASEIWGDAILNGDGLASKWANIKFKPLLAYLRKKGKVRDIGHWRRLIAKYRDFIPERKMCAGDWDKIEYPKVPSVAMARYTKAFGRHDEDRFAQFKTKVEKGEEKINASVLFPHDLVRTVLGGDYQIADAQFDALPNYMEESKKRVMTIVDTSGSMSITVSGMIQAWHVATSLGLYCSDRLGKDNPFYRKFMQFCDETKMTDWTGKKFSECYSGARGYRMGSMFNGAVGSTRIDKALDTILSFAQAFNATNEQIPNVLLIVSDMQFHSGVNAPRSGDWRNPTSDMTEVERCLAKWESAGYTRPQVVYWNTAGNAGSPATVNHKDVGLVSGFSPAILKAIFGGEDFTPKGIMLRAIEKYQVVEPQ